MHYLIATDSVHTTAAACDYLQPRVAPDDVITVLTVDPVDAATGDVTDEEGRDRGDALNVARVRLPGADVRSERRTGAVDRAILEAAADHDVDVLLLGVHGGRPEATGLGGTTATVLPAADQPVIVLPVD